MVRVSYRTAAAFRENAYLRSLGPADAALLAPMTSFACYGVDHRLGDRADTEALMYFPLTLVAVMRDGRAQGGRGVIGREGLIGWPALLGLSTADYGANVLFTGGTALTLPVRRMQVACFASPTLAMSLLRFVQSYTVQLSNMLEHSRCATMSQRLSAWLLMLHDRIDGDSICLTHQRIASHLGVRRASVTDALHVLEGRRAVRCDRSAITVRDRSELEHCAGKAYGRTEEDYRRSIGPFGKSTQHGMGGREARLRSEPPVAMPAR